MPLPAYWLCQGYVIIQIAIAMNRSFRLQTVLEIGERIMMFMRIFFWALNKWEFFTQTYPSILFLRYPNARGLKDGHLGHDRTASAYLKSLASWAETIKSLNILLKNQNRDFPLILLAPAPVFAFKFVEDLQLLVGITEGPYPLDLESWSANRKHLLLFLHLMGNANVVLLSGDVHYSFTSTVKFSVFDDKTLRNAIKLFPKDVSPPKIPSGASPSYDFLWSANLFNLPVVLWKILPMINLSNYQQFDDHWACFIY